jgi:hypothetical protein
LVHKKLPPYTRQECKKAFWQSVQLQQHISSTHI